MSMFVWYILDFKVIEILNSNEVIWIQITKKTKKHFANEATITETKKER